MIKWKNFLSLRKWKSNMLMFTIVLSAVKFTHPPKVTRLILPSVIKIYKIHQDKLPFLLKLKKTHTTTHRNLNRACALIHITSRPLMTRTWPKGREVGSKQQSYKKSKSNYWTSYLNREIKKPLKGKKN